MSRFDGYNRHDFHYPNTSREAFGSNYYGEEKKSTSKDIWFYGFVAGLVVLKLLIL